MLSPAATPIGQQRLSAQFVRRDDECAVRLGVWHIDYPQVASTGSLSDGNARAAASGAIFAGARQYLFYLRLRDMVPMNVGLACLWIDVEADVHDRPSVVGAVLWSRASCIAPSWRDITRVRILHAGSLFICVHLWFPLLVHVECLVNRCDASAIARPVWMAPKRLRPFVAPYF